jgi:hypothetical protein
LWGFSVETGEPYVDCGAWGQDEIIKAIPYMQMRERFAIGTHLTMLKLEDGITREQADEFVKGARQKWVHQHLLRASVSFTGVKTPRNHNPASFCPGPPPELVKEIPIRTFAEELMDL